jgi:thioredoxin-related protein
MKTILHKIFAAAVLLCVASPAVFAQSGWTTHFDEALAQAKTDDKAVLLNFTGSDWCPWCIKMKQETLDTGEFRAYAKDNLELVEVDFPNNKPQSDQLKAQNQRLQKKFKVDGFPTFVIVSKNGKVLGKQVGYLDGGPQAFIAELKSFYHAPQRTAGSPDDDFDAFFKKPPQSSVPQ